MVMSGPRPTLVLETCLMCDRLAPARFLLYRFPDTFGHERAPAQQRLAPLCSRCHALLARAGTRGLVETASGARWTLVSPAPHAHPR
jgi:hypothetical protein